MYITKRSGEKELFNRKKITEAIRKAISEIEYCNTFLSNMQKGDRKQ